MFLDAQPGYYVVELVQGAIFDHQFTRTLGAERLVVALNFSQEKAEFELPGDIQYAKVELLIANYPVDPDENVSRFSLRPYEARVYRLQV